MMIPQWLRKTVFFLPVMMAWGCASPSEPGKPKKSFKDKMYEAVRQHISSTYHDPQSDTKLARAEELFAAGNYKEAEKIFADVADNKYNSISLLERARFMEAESVRMQGKLPRAVDTYNRLMKDYPTSVYTESAALRMYAIAEGWAKDSVSDIEARESGKSYWDRLKMPNIKDNSKPRIDQEGEVLKTFENISTYAPQSTVADKAMFWCGYIHYSRGNYADADHFFSMLAEGYKDSPLKQSATEYAIRAKNQVNGGATYDGQKTAEALQLVNNLEATDPTYSQNKDKQTWLHKQKLSIRLSQAEKDYETAEFYRRKGLLPSAYFYYHLVRMRYPGTKYSDLAMSRLQEIDKVKAQYDAEHAKERVAPAQPTVGESPRPVPRANPGVMNLGTTGYDR